MADVDDELLALVGGDESDDEGSDQEMNISRSGSESPEPGSTKARKASPPKKSRKKRHDDSDEEEGEA